MDLHLAGRRAIVAGASSGLGRAIALALAAEGADVTAIARNEARLQEVADEAKRNGAKLSPLVCDLGKIADIERLASSVSETDILVLNGGGPPPGPVSRVTDEVWLAQFETMFLGATRLAARYLPGMRSRRHGRIIALVSSGVLQPIPNLGISNAIRLALVGWAKTLATEVAGEGVTVNCIAPGRVDTPRIVELDKARATREGLDIADVQKDSTGKIPAGRYGHPAEFAALATFLAGEQAGYITGGVLRVDGGMILGI